LNKGAKAPLLIIMNYVYYIELMNILYWILGYIGCGILVVLLTPFIEWVIDHIEDGKTLEKSTYAEKWDYLYSDFPIIITFLVWPIIILIIFVFVCKESPIIIKYLCGKKQRYIDYVNEKAAKIMGE